MNNSNDNPNIIVIDPPDRSPEQLTEQMDRSTNLNETAAAQNTDKTALQRRIRPIDVRMTTRQLATLLHAGLPLVSALTALVEQFQQHGKTTSPYAMAQIIQHLADRVKAGSSLADALQQYPDIFSRLYVNMVRAGQASATLEDVLLKLAEMLDKRARLTAKIRAALIYPAMMAAAAAGVVFFLVAFVVPGISEVFLDMNRELPWPTTALMAASNFIQTYSLLIAICFCLIALAIAAYLKTDLGKMKWDQFKLKLPLIGDLLLKSETVRLTRTLGTMLSSGVTILDSLDIVKGVMQNSVIAKSLDNISAEVARGHSTAGAFKQTGLFAPVIYHTIAIGEMSGNVAEQLINIADAYDQEIDTAICSLTALIEPIILMIMGLVVGFIVLAMLLPIFEINQMI